MRRRSLRRCIITMAVSLAVLAAAAPAFAADVAGVNHDVYWKYDEETATLTIGPDKADDMQRQETRFTKKEGERVSPGRCSPAWKLHNYDAKRVVITGPVYPESTMDWFGSCRKITQIEGLPYINTTYTVYMKNMFDQCGKLQKLDLSYFDFSKVTHTDEMFRWCTSLRSLDLNGFGASNLKSSFAMFQNCTSLQELDLSGCDSSQLETASWMFQNCSNLRSVDLSGLPSNEDGKGKLANAVGTFINCGSLRTVYVKHGTDWAKGGVLKSYKDLFTGCRILSGEEGSQAGKSDRTYARVDQGKSAPGYFTAKHTWVTQKDTAGKETRVCSVCNKIEKPKADDHQHDGVDFQPWTNADALPTEPGCYYLTRDVQIKKDKIGSTVWTIFRNNEITICLNGHAIKPVKDGKGNFTYNILGTWNLYDCSAGKGTITDGRTGKGSCIRVGGTMNMYGGKVTGNNTSGHGAGALVNGTLNMYGGEFSNNTSGDNGGGVYVGRGRLNMYGGKITGNQAVAGGGVYVDEEGSFATSGGSVTGNRATSGKANDVFQLDGHVVTFDTDGGTTIEKQHVSDGQKAERPKDPYKDDRDFVKWLEYGKDYDFTKPVTEDITLTAVWKHSNRDLVIVPAVKATCTKAGNIEHWKCTECGRVFLDAAGKQETSPGAVAIIATGHKAAEPVREKEVQATCTKPGSYEEVVKCSICGTELSREKRRIEQTGHEWSEWEKTEKDEELQDSGQGGTTEDQIWKKSAALAQGELAVSEDAVMYERTCRNCGNTKHLDTPGTGCTHTNLTVTEEIPATCTEIGVAKNAECADCGAWFRYDEDGQPAEIKTDEDADKLLIPEKDHKWTFEKFSWQGSTKRGYDAYAGYRCDNCHSFIEINVTEDCNEDYDFLSCQDGGTMILTASVSEEDALDHVARSGDASNKGILKVNLPAFAHEWTRWVTIEKETRDDYGVAMRACLFCSEIEYRDIPPGGDPAPKAISRLVKGKKSFTVKWKKASKSEKAVIDGYQVRYSKKKSFASAKTKSIGKNTATSKKIKGLAKKKTYYVKLRSYRSIDGVKYYSSWSKVKKVKTK